MHLGIGIFKSSAGDFNVQQNWGTTVLREIKRKGQDLTYKNNLYVRIE